MFSSKKKDLTNFSEMRAEYCKFMLKCTRNNLHIKVFMAFFCLLIGLFAAYWELGRGTDYERNLEAIKEESKKNAQQNGE